MGSRAEKGIIYPSTFINYLGMIFLSPLRPFSSKGSIKLISELEFSYVLFSNLKIDLMNYIVYDLFWILLID